MSHYKCVARVRLIFKHIALYGQLWYLIHHSLDAGDLVVFLDSSSYFSLFYTKNFSFAGYFLTYFIFDTIYKHKKRGDIFSFWERANIL